MAFGPNDAYQSAMGAVIAALFVVVLRSEPINIDPTIGFWVGMVWIYITISPYITRRFETKMHAAFNVGITLAITSFLSIIFNLMTVEELSGFQFFGSTGWIVAMIALPTATFWDKLNITNQYDRWYYRKRRA